MNKKKLAAIICTIVGCTATSIIIADIIYRKTIGESIENVNEAYKLLREGSVVIEAGNNLLKEQGSIISELMEKVDLSNEEKVKLYERIANHGTKLAENLANCGIK